MPKKKYEAGQRDTELLEKLLVLQLYKLGASQGQISKVVGRAKVWVNGVLRGLPKRG